MKDIFSKKMFLGFLIPSLFSAIGLAFSNIADSLVVGIRIGEPGLAAISITLPIYMIYALCYVGIGTGGAVELSKLTGGGKSKEASELFNIMIETSFAISMVFVILGLFFTKQVLFILGVRPGNSEIYRLSYDYTRVLLCAAPVFFLNTPLYSFLRCDNAQKLSAISFVTGNIIDVLLNVVFILILNTGISGAVWATVIGQSVSLIIYLPYFFRKESLFKLKWVRPVLKPIIATVKTGFSSSNQFVSQFLFVLISNNILLKIAGGYAVAVFDVVMNVSYIALFFHTAATEAMQPLAGIFYGERNTVAQKLVLRLALTVGAIAGTALLLVIAIISPAISSVFNANLTLAPYAIRVYCLGGVFAGINIILCGYYQSVGREKLTFVISQLRGTVFLLLFAIVFGTIGEYWFWWVFPASEILSFLMLLIFNRLQAFKGSGDTVEDERIFNLLIISSNGDNRIPNDKIEEFCERWGADFKQTYYVTMTIEEICGAIIENTFNGTDEIYIQITLISFESGEFMLHIRDNACSFNPFELKTKQVSLEDSFEELNGLGIMMVKKKAKKFYYHRYQGLNTLTVCV